MGDGGGVRLGRALLTHPLTSRWTGHPCRDSCFPSCLVFCLSVSLFSSVCPHFPLSPRAGAVRELHALRAARLPPPLQQPGEHGHLCAPRGGALPPLPLVFLSLRRSFSFPFCLFISMFSFSFSFDPSSASLLHRPAASAGRRRRWRGGRPWTGN